MTATECYEQHGMSLQEFRKELGLTVEEFNAGQRVSNREFNERYRPCPLIRDQQGRLGAL